MFLNILINFNNSLVNAFGFSGRQSYCRLITFVFLPLNIYILYMYVFLLVVLARSWSRMFSRDGENGHSCLIPDLTIE